MSVLIAQFIVFGASACPSSLPGPPLTGAQKDEQFLKLVGGHRPSPLLTMTDQQAIAEGHDICHELSSGQRTRKWYEDSADVQVPELFWFYSAATKTYCPDAGK
ncbi:MULTISPECIES: DUF732 domain-containing protein [unclassified Mycobacterium]|uniref:DUF732 domain-containing protein n=1 Tax=unclassified Mycobacterium TaxID=2642494 RepID=UPI000801C7C7|nr:MULTISPECIES: DUF732 domain-containing protein [unclassified Mycobacterium]OBG55770.1 hypothetical protein A5703_07420 [Mycobacterium sp. E188]OBH41094.1 hypothetical protein A5691_19405 [Mycobacterium sp. E183]